MVVASASVARRPIRASISMSDEATSVAMIGVRVR